LGIHFVTDFNVYVLYLKSNILHTNNFIPVGVCISNAYKPIRLCAQNTSLTPPLFIELSMPSQEIERSCICGLGVPILPLTAILLLDCGTVATVCHFLFSSLLEILCWHINIL
jgi:hypothetical protein